MTLIVAHITKVIKQVIATKIYIKHIFNYEIFEAFFTSGKQKQHQLSLSSSTLQMEAPAVIEDRKIKRRLFSLEVNLPGHSAGRAAMSASLGLLS